MTKLIKILLLTGGAYLVYRLIKPSLQRSVINEKARGVESRLDNTAIDDPNATMVRMMGYPYYPFLSFEDAIKEFPQNISP